jgi:hypothetical protein
MRFRSFSYALLLLILTFTTSCEGYNTSSAIVIPTFTPVDIKPTRSVPVLQATNYPSYPPPGVSSNPMQVTNSLPYPVPAFGDNPQPAPTIDITPLPPMKQLPTVTTAPTISPLPEYTQGVQYFYPKCSPDGLYLKCSDEVLGIKYRYPSHWGYFDADLINGTCGGYVYSYGFYGSSEVSAGGTSVDYCKGIGGDLFTLFKGFKPGHGCEEFPEAQDCRQINDNVVIATYFPNFQSICNYGPGTIFTPHMFVGINIPGNRIVSGMVFSVNFLSIKSMDKLLEPFGGIVTYTKKCVDPKTEKEYTQLLDEISIKVKQGTFDEETGYKIKGIMDFANSISFSQ